ncbi:hypothetical protein [Streptomyces sp. H34-S4]|uniref:hypothetical protein n=1 Tax=Streptomyces sp. H34-S4 TaxID=2996463 RepID=UPI00226DD08A|nr:hypothetical protein [Streptomyces sp. H34-S4]MCY0934059.1 hypothetical protein [Streptomyces sp. H34-S4]
MMLRIQVRPGYRDATSAGTTTANTGNSAKSTAMASMAGRHSGTTRLMARKPATASAAQDPAPAGPDGRGPTAGTRSRTTGAAHAATTTQATASTEERLAAGPVQHPPGDRDPQAARGHAAAESRRLQEYEGAAGPGDASRAVRAAPRRLRRERRRPSR